MCVCVSDVTMMNLSRGPEYANCTGRAYNILPNANRETSVLNDELLGASGSAQKEN